VWAKSDICDCLVSSVNVRLLQQKLWFLVPNSQPPVWSHRRRELNSLDNSRPSSIENVETGHVHNRPTDDSFVGSISSSSHRRRRRDGTVEFLFYCSDCCSRLLQIVADSIHNARRHQTRQFRRRPQCESGVSGTRNSCAYEKVKNVKT